MLAFTSVKKYILNAVIALDQVLNALLGGSPDETLSSRAYRTEQQGKIFGKIFRPLIDLVFFFDPLHCYDSYLAESTRRQLPDNFLLSKIDSTGSQVYKHKHNRHNSHNQLSR